MCVDMASPPGAQAARGSAPTRTVIVGSALVKTLFDESFDRGLKALGRLASALEIRRDWSAREASLRHWHPFTLRGWKTALKNEPRLAVP